MTPLPQGRCFIIIQIFFFYKRIMIRRFCLYCLSLMLITGVIGCKTSNSGPTDGKVRRYPYERLHIHYEVSGGARGIEDAYSSEYGKYEGRYSDLEILRMIGNERLRTVTISRGADLYTAEIEHNDGTHVLIPQLDSMYKGLTPTKSVDELSDESLRAGRLSKVGSDVILGRMCDRWSTLDEKLNLWINNGMLMRKRTPDMEGGHVDMIATMIDTNWTVDSSKFIVPVGIPIREKKAE